MREYKKREYKKNIGSKEDYKRKEKEKKITFWMKSRLYVNI